MPNSAAENTFELSLAKSNLISIVFTKVLSEEESTKQSEDVVAAVIEIFDKSPQKNFGLLVDLTSLETLPPFFTSKSREAYIRLSKHPQLLRVAIVGANTFYKLVTNFLMTATGKGINIQWFSRKEEALKWLGKSK